MSYLGNRTQALADDVAQAATNERDELNRRQMFLAVALLREAADLLERPKRCLPNPPEPEAPSAAS